MKGRFWIRTLCLMLLILIGTACGSSPAEEEGSDDAPAVQSDTPAPAPTDEPEPEPTPTDEPAPEPTDEPEPTATAEPEPTAAPTEQPTDTPIPAPTDLVIGLNQVPNNLCVTCNFTFQRRIMFNVVDPLIGRDFGPDGQGTTPIPGIATAWEFASDTELDLTIRDDAVFHNGDPVTVEDVAFTLSAEKLWGPDALTPDALAIGVFENVEVLDDSTVRITTAFPDPALISRLQSHIGRVVPQDYFLEVGVDGFRQAPIGSGPYQIESYAARDEMRLVAFDQYWGGEPPLASITYRDIPETSTRVAGLLAGELDLIVGVAPQQFGLLEAEGYAVAVMPQENIQMFAFMSGPEELPVNDPLIRRALIHAADLGLIAEQLYAGTVTPLFGIDSPAYADFYQSGASTYDLDLAQSLVAEAGYEGEPIKLQFISNNFVLVNETAILLQEMWAAAGLKVQLDIIPDFTLHTLNPPTDVSMWSTSNNISMPDPFNPVCSTFTSAGFYAGGGRITPSLELDTLCQQLAETGDLDSRRAVWDEIQAEWDANPQALFLWQRPEYYAYRADLAWAPRSDFNIPFDPESYPAE